VEYYAHTAVRADGGPESNTAKWQPLSTHLRNVCQLCGPLAFWARPNTMPNPVRFVAPICRAAETNPVMGLSLSSDWSSRCHLLGRALDSKAGEDCHRRLCLRNAFEQVYPLGG
jgi:hypothetical protein